MIASIINTIKELTTRQISLMEVCGTHTMSIARSGIRTMMPEQLRLLSGPGCPVCVTAQETIDYTIALAKNKNVIIVTFGDMVGVPGTVSSLEPYSPTIIYSPLDALDIAENNKNKEIIFIGVGFETTSPTIAATVLAADKRGIDNFYVLPAFKTIPPALDFIARSPRIDVQGFILPGHVSTIIGTEPYQFLATKYHMPGCITGFEPIEILSGILDLVKQLAEKKAHIDITYRKVVKPEGNQKALEILYSVFESCDANWRGIGNIEKSGLTFKQRYEKYNAFKKFSVKVPKSKIPKGCICGNVLLGISLPLDCKLFASTCTPLTPVGPCMVSSEGSCAAYYKYGGTSQKNVDKKRKQSKRNSK
ncbi:MAG: hydrogenase formation protein HypD [bacterium]